VNTYSLASRLTDAKAKQLTLHFGRPEIVHGHGILLPCIAGQEAFHALREHVLGSMVIRHQAPHITLAHPRNPKSSENSLANANRLPELAAIRFAQIVLIEQTGVTPWRVLQTYEIQRDDA
jgi:hypothetical protein